MDKPIRVWKEDYMSWNRLPLLSPCIREMFLQGYAPGEHEKEVKGSEAQRALGGEERTKKDGPSYQKFIEHRTRWIHFHQFMAQLWRDLDFDLAWFGVVSISGGLERKFSLSGTNVLYKEVSIIWIETAGDRIWRACGKRLGSDGSLRCSTDGTKLGGYKVERWDLWRDELEQLSKTKSYSSTLRRSAKKCSESMKIME
eukprot:TRINITY_DN986_c0_g1_i1.p1 TRINITY_DN986_c0_g1~~TRINITY_DN986_c0_g1_i1.p1  ORF type:complete len:199 (-),score=29.13 TRINITY_DN986_c0_g1_i1:146-742(-)